MNWFKPADISPSAQTHLFVTVSRCAASVCPSPPRSWSATWTESSLRRGRKACRRIWTRSPNILCCPARWAWRSSWTPTATLLTTQVRDTCVFFHTVVHNRKMKTIIKIISHSDCLRPRNCPAAGLHVLPLGPQVGGAGAPQRYGYVVSLAMFHVSHL